MHAQIQAALARGLPAFATPCVSNAQGASERSPSTLSGSWCRGTADALVWGLNRVWPRRRRPLGFAPPCTELDARGAPDSGLLPCYAAMSLGPLSFLLRPAVLNVAAEEGENAAYDVDAIGGEAADEAVGVSTLDPDLDLGAALRTSVQDVYIAHVSENGVDYEALASSPRFGAYKVAAGELVRYDAANSLRTDADRVAFFVNLYNALTIHAFAVLGPPSGNSFSRLMFTTQASYRVGPFVLSLSDIENGVLRANKGVAIWPAPFSKVNDPRLRLCVDRPDPRIHFVLNCGAASCPPIRYLVAERVDEQLALATEVFLGDDDNFSVALAPANAAADVVPLSNRTMKEEADRIRTGEAGASMRGWVVTLSAIFKWYKTDFAPNNEDVTLLSFIAKNAGEVSAKGDLLRAVMQADPLASRVTIRHAPYDWSLNSSEGL